MTDSTSLGDIRRLGLALCLVAMTTGQAAASYAIYVGKEKTADGTIMVGGGGDEPSSHWLEVVPAADYGYGDSVTLGAGPDAVGPYGQPWNGSLIDVARELLPLDWTHTFRHLTMNYTEFSGFPGTLTNGGLNENGVAARDVAALARRDLRDLTEASLPQHGPTYSDLSRLVMEYATSARHAVEIVGELIDRRGYASYGGNSHLFADENEAWVLLNFPGEEKLWIAEKLDDDEIRVLGPGYIGKAIPFDSPTDDYMWSKNFIMFAKTKGWFNENRDPYFDVNYVYGCGCWNDEADPDLYGCAEELTKDDVLCRYFENVAVPRRTEIESELEAAAPIALRNMLDATRDPRLSWDATGYGQVAHLRPGVRPELQTLWVSATGAVTSPFVPYRVGVESIEPEFGKHRYLTKGESARYLTRDWQIQEAVEFAGRVFKRLMYFTCDRPDEFLPMVQGSLRLFESNLLAEQGTVDETADLLFQNQPELAVEYITGYTDGIAHGALSLGRTLLQSVEETTRMLWGIEDRRPTTDRMSGTDAEITCTSDEVPLFLAH